MDTATASTPQQSRPKFVRWALLVGIIAILNIFFTVVTALVFPQPKYEDFCPVNPPPVSDAKACESAGGVWIDTTPLKDPNMTKPVAATGYCDFYQKCQKPYQDAGEQHALYAFVLMIGLGALALIVGLMPIGSSIVSSGLSYGGVVAFIIGSGQYWGNAGNWIRLAIATLALLALLYIGWKRFKD